MFRLGNFGLVTWVFKQFYFHSYLLIDINYFQARITTSRDSGPRSIWWHRIESLCRLRTAYMRILSSCVLRVVMFNPVLNIPRVVPHQSQWFRTSLKSNPTRRSSSTQWSPMFHESYPLIAARLSWMFHKSRPSSGLLNLVRFATNISQCTTKLLNVSTSEDNEARYIAQQCSIAHPA